MAVSLGRLEVETADHVVLRYDLAGAGTRGSAALIDGLLSVLMVLGLSIVSVLIGTRLPPSVAAQLAGVTAFLILMSWVAYFVLLEWLWNGQTIGKRRAGLRVIGPDGEPARFTAVLIRNLVRLVDFLPGWYALGVVMIFITPRSQRLGDLAAGTYVVRAPKPRLDWLSLRTPEPSVGGSSAAWGTPPRAASVRISGESQRLVREFVAREQALSAADRAKLAAVIARPLRAAAPELDDPDDTAFLHRIAASLRAAGTDRTARPRSSDALSVARGLSGPSQQLVRSFAMREGALQPDVRSKIAAGICATVRTEVPGLDISDDVELLRILANGLA